MLYSIPSITTQNENGLYFVISYLHARDRLWQLEVRRYLVYGILSEISGENTMRRDSWIHILGQYRAFERAFSHLSKEDKRSLESQKEY
ncbi:penicillin acylase family protein [Microbulbifer sp. 2205BS26-8]|uniref:penicillin acylase family protein n=1 Tax=Microbulbifer sp. 2205BS26-8 TaxID=3064386 RepID=UPI003530A796